MKDIRHYRGIVNKATLVLFGTAIILAVVFIVQMTITLVKDDIVLESDVISEVVVSQENISTPVPSEKPNVLSTQIVENTQQTLKRLLPYYEKNSDLVGWIKIEDTVIDYPVVFSGDNEYYLDHNFDKQSSKKGAIFLDFRCDIYDFSKTRNIILYGHRMKDGRMFKSLIKYYDYRFLLNNPAVKFDVLFDEHEWEIFSVFETYTDFYYIETIFPDDDVWLEFIEKCRTLSMHDNDIKLKADDIVLTLSTCTSKPNERLVVMARLIDKS